MKRNKCTQRLQSAFIILFSLLPDDKMQSYNELESSDIITARIAAGQSHRCKCGKLYDRDGGICMTGHCEYCDQSFCFNCHMTLKTQGVLKKAEAHFCLKKSCLNPLLAATADRVQQNRAAK